jgi:hypothetical protein
MRSGNVSDRNASGSGLHEAMEAAFEVVGAALGAFRDALN